MGRIGIYAGTFNPIHSGHIRAAQWAAQALRLDKLLLIPDRDPPHKQLGAGAATYAQRLAMARLAAGESKALEVWEIPSESEGPTYAFQTAEAVRQQYPGEQLFWLLGSDSFARLPQWKGADRLLRLVTPAVLCRGDRQERETARATGERLGADWLMLDNPVEEISSTQLRRLLAFGCGREFLPEPVLAYIREQGLYDTAKNWEQLPIDALQQQVCALLKPGRVNHVLGCRQAAAELAKRHGADVTDAERAALLHDITKALDGPLQLTLCREYGIILDTFSTQNPKTLHALTGSLVARRVFGENDAVVSAIASHTTGKPAMNLLEKIIYVADYMEPNRDFPGVERLRQLAAEDIDKALLLGLTMTVSLLREQKRDISPESGAAIRYLEENGVFV